MGNRRHSERAYLHQGLAIPISCSLNFWTSLTACIKESRILSGLILESNWLFLLSSSTYLTRFIKISPLVFGPTGFSFMLNFYWEYENVHFTRLEAAYLSNRRTTGLETNFMVSACFSQALAPMSSFAAQLTWTPSPWKGEKEPCDWPKSPFMRHIF